MIDTGVLNYAYLEGIDGNGMTTDVIDGHFTENANGFHYHLRYSDANGNGQPDPSEISAEFEHIRVFCP
jgi:hypothetical protein